VSDGEIEVPVDTLDRSVPADWNSIDLIVMDIEGSEVKAMRGGAAVLARTQRLYVEFAPEQLEEQGSTAEEFLALAGQFFRSVYVIDGSMKFMPARDLATHLPAHSARRGFLLNLLFTQDTERSETVGRFVSP